MVRYSYDSKGEVFKREDNRGSPLRVNIAEAQRIVSLLNLGYCTTDIINKVQLYKGTSSTVRNFIKNYEAGNIDIPDDAPAPVQLIDEMNDDRRIEALEERVRELERKKSISERFKEWIRS
ncbi:MAG: hypothetical protein J6Y78_04595 [Paludibacteraceae bacterium]|nr:hypothetical protein [Paludibacteraceae bacterium]